MRGDVLVEIDGSSYYYTMNVDHRYFMGHTEFYV